MECYYKTLPVTQFTPTLCSPSVLYTTVPLCLSLCDIITLDFRVELMHNNVKFPIIIKKSLPLI